jgi:ankyrin repeat protein
MASFRKLAYFVAMLTAVGLFAFFAVVITAAPDKLLEASAAGDLSRVKTLLAAKYNVNAKDVHGYTALILASFDGHLEVVRALLAAGADVNAKAFNGETAMSLAKKGGHPEVVELLKAVASPP